MSGPTAESTHEAAACSPGTCTSPYLEPVHLPTWNLYISPLRMLLSTVPPKMYMASEMTAAAWKSLPLGSWVERGQVSRVGQGRARSPAEGWLRPEAGQAVTKDVVPLDLKEGREHSYRHRAEGRAYGSERAGPARDPRSGQSRYSVLRAAPRGPGQQGVNSWASAHLLCDLDKYLSEPRLPIFERGQSQSSLGVREW